MLLALFADRVAQTYMISYKSSLALNRVTVNKHIVHPILPSVTVAEAIVLALVKQFLQKSGQTLINRVISASLRDRRRGSTRKILRSKAKATDGEGVRYQFEFKCCTVTLSDGGQRHWRHRSFYIWQFNVAQSAINRPTTISIEVTAEQEPTAGMKCYWYWHRKAASLNALLQASGTRRYTA